MSPIVTPNSLPTKRRRRRPARSCEQCRRSKVRCDLGQPCGHCVRARAALQCSYRDGSPMTTSAPAPAPTSSSFLTTQSVRQQKTPASSDLSSRTEADADDALQTEILGRYPRTSGGEPSREQIGQQRLAERQKTFPLLQPPVTHLTSASSIPPVRPRLRHVPEKTKVFGQTHWLHLAEKFPVLGAFNAVEVEPSLQDAQAELIEILSETRALRYALKSQFSVKLEQPVWDLVGTLPSKETCDELVRCYFRTLEPLYRVVHIPSFWKDYETIWDAERSTATPAVFMTKLTLILAIGTTFYHTGDDAETTRLNQLAQTWVQNAQWWLVGPSEKSTYNTDGLQVFCLLIIARQSTFNCTGATSWLSTASLLRMAITMGLHRNPKLFPSLSFFQREFRARLWATVLELSLQSALDLGLPLNLGVDDYDAPMPLNYNDAELNATPSVPPSPSDTFTDSSLQILLAKSQALRVNAIRLLNDFKKERSYEAALKMGTELRSACREVAAFFHAHTTTENPSLDKPTAFHRKFMDIHLRRFILFLHREFMVYARADPRFYLSRKHCVDSALVILAANDDSSLGMPADKLDDLARLAIVGRGVFKAGLSLDALMVLALEIVTQLDGEEAAPRAHADAVDELAAAARAPLVAALERAYDQLEHLLSFGSRSFKRLIFAGAYLSYVRALETGRSPKPAIYEAVTELLRKCLTVLREIHVGATPTEIGGLGDEGMMMDLFPFDFLSGDANAGWDVSNFLSFGMNESGTDPMTNPI